MSIRGTGFFVVAVLLLAGCPGPQNPCTPTSCGEGSTCDEETGACVLACDEECASHEFCSNRQCVARYTAVSVTRPREGGAVGRGSAVEATLTRAAGASYADPTQLSFDVRGDGDAGLGSGTLVRVDAGLFSGTLPETLPEGAVLAVTASYPAAGLVSERRYVTVDYTAPVFLLSWQAPARRAGSPGQWAEERDLGLDAAYKRDELATVEVSSAEVVDSATVYLRVYGVSDAGTPTEPGVAVAVTAGEGCGQAYCGTAVVDLAVPQFDVLRGNMQVVVTGKDEAGNDGSGDGGIPVTRLKWAYDYDSADFFRASPSVGRGGNIYAGSVSLVGESGAVAAVNSEGELLWEHALGGITSAMPLGQMDGGDRVYVANRVPGESHYRRMNGSDGGWSNLTTGLNGEALAAMALTHTQASGEPGPVETLFLYLNNAGASEFQFFRPDGKSGSRGNQVAVAEPASYPATIVADGGNAYVVDAQGNLRAFSINAEATSLTERYAKPVGLFITGSALAGTEFVGGGGGPGVKAVFGAVPADGGTLWRSPNTGGTPSSVVVDEVGAVFAGTNSGVMKAVPTAPTAAVTERTVGQDFYGAPLLVEDERLYTASTNGRLVLWTRQLEPVWVGNIPGASFEASMNIDCAREGGEKVPGRPGVLYLLDKGGVLYSVITDHGLDTEALWPRYQRDPGNTGNAASDLQAYVCP